MMKKRKQDRTSIGPRHRKLLYVLLFLLSTVIIFLPIVFRVQLQQFSFLGLFGVFLINAIGSATIFLPSPAFLSVGIAGNIYNPIIVALVSSIGSSLGEGVGYLFGHSSKEILNFRKHKILYALNNFLFQKYGMYAILFFSLIPNPLFDGLGILVGFSSFSLRKFLFFVFLGRFIRNLAIASFGNLF
jgi:membrane protein YqaA with SNARE-associated domain